MEENLKQLLLKDLSARLPYGVECLAGDAIVGRLAGIVPYMGTVYLYLQGVLTPYKVEEVKPYLRSMDDMTEEEKNEFIHYAGYEVEESVNGRHYEYYLKDYVGTPEKPSCNYDAVDWLNAHHFDFYNLIEKGLAIEVTEENNPYKD